MGLEKQNKEPKQNQCSLHVRCPETEESRKRERATMQNSNAGLVRKLSRCYKNVTVKPTNKASERFKVAPHKPFRHTQSCQNLRVCLLNQ